MSSTEIQPIDQPMSEYARRYDKVISVGIIAVGTQLIGIGGLVDNKALIEAGIALDSIGGVSPIGIRFARVLAQQARWLVNHNVKKIHFDL